MPAWPLRSGFSMPRPDRELRERLQDISVADLRAMSDEDFKTAVKLLLHTLGFDVDESDGNDIAGVDLVAWDSEKHPWIVRFERGSDITEPMVRAYYDFIRRHEVERGIMVTTEALHEDARQWTQRALLYLWPGDRLQKMLQLTGGKRWKVTDTV